MAELVGDDEGLPRLRAALPAGVVAVEDVDEALATAEVAQRREAGAAATGTFLLLRMTMSAFLRLLTFVKRTLTPDEFHAFTAALTAALSLVVST